MVASGVMFHHFYDGRHPRGQGAISSQNLEDLINSLGRNNVLPAQDWLTRALSGTLGDNDLCLTFDDALKCQYDVAVPVMRTLGLTGFWFVYSSVFDGNIETLEVYRHFRTTEFAHLDQFYDAFFETALMLYPTQYEAALTGFDPRTYLGAYPFYTDRDRLFRYLRDDGLGVERYGAVMQSMMGRRGYDVRAASAVLWMNNADIKRLHDEGHVVGLHSYTHPTRLCELNAQAQQQEYRKNFDHLHSVLGAPPSVMAHPCNSYSAETISLLREMGIRLGFRANMEPVANRSVYEFPRQDHANLMKALNS